MELPNGWKRLNEGCITHTGGDVFWIEGPPDDTIKLLELSKEMAEMIGQISTLMPDPGFTDEFKIKDTQIACEAMLLKFKEWK